MGWWDTAKLGQTVCQQKQRIAKLERALEVALERADKRGAEAERYKSVMQGLERVKQMVAQTKGILRSGGHTPNSGRIMDMLYEIEEVIDEQDI